MREIEEYDWLAKHDPVPAFKREPHSLSTILRFNIKETRYDRCLRFLQSLSSTCIDCTMCELGRKEAKKDYEARDPHVFSSMNPKRIIVVGQNPGWSEVKQGKPFVGASGETFDKHLAAHGLSRDDLYICNIVRCWTQDNAKPTSDSVSACLSYLDMEIRIICPQLIVTVGSVAFQALCPKANYSESLGKLTDCERYKQKVFAVYHPSPRNLMSTDRKADFARQMAVMCGLVKKLAKIEGT